MRAIEFIIESNNIASAEKVWDYVDGSHPKDQQGGGFLKSLVMLNPQYELKRVPLSSLHVPNDKDEGNDPYGRAMFVDVDHAREYSQHNIDKKPLVVDSQGHILDGAHRAWAASELLNKTDIMAWVPVKQGVAEGKVINTYLWHGSRQKIPMLEPRQSVDTGGAAGSNQNAIYATSDPKVAIAMGLTTAGSDTGMFPNDPQMVLFSGKIRKGEYVYLHKLPFNGPDGKPQFVQGGNSREFHSIPGVEGIKPIEIKEIPVNKYLNLIRKATPADLKLRKRYMKKQGVAEGKITLSTDPNWYGATVDNYQASGPVVNIPANQLVGFEPDDKMNQPKSKVNVEKIVAGLKQGAKLPPLLVRKYKNGYQVLDGHHRFWAYKLLGVKSIPAQIVPDSDIEEISKQGVAEGYVPINISKMPTDPAPKPKKVEPKHKYVDNRADWEQHYQARANKLYNVVGKFDRKVLNPEPIKGLTAAEEFMKQNGLSLANADLESISTLRFHATGVDASGKRVVSEPLLSMKDVRNFYKQHGINPVASTTDLTTTDEGSVTEASLGDYRKKAAVSQAGAKIKKFFGRDDPAAVAAADQTIAKREKGLARADARIKPYTPPKFDAEKYQRDLTAKYPNIDELVRKAELNRDPDYEMADGQAYYAARDAEQNYQKLRQIQRVIQGLNESQADAKKKELSTGTGRINPDTGRPWTPSELKAKYSDVDFDKEAKKADLARMRDQAKQERLIDKLKTSLGDPRDTTSDLAKSFLNKGGLGLDFKPPGPRPAPTPAPAPVTVKGQPPGFTANNLAQQPGMAQYMQQKPITPKPAPNFAQGPTGYKTTTTNVPPVATTTTAQTAEKNTSDILQALTKMGFKTKEAEAAINRLPPNISTKDAIFRILQLQGKQMSESLTWSQNFDPGRSLYRRIKQES